MKIHGDKIVEVDSAFAEEIRQRCGENVYLCYQCRKCASGCPNRMFMDSTPAELMRYVQLGMVDEAIRKNTTWYCASCQTCTARCPQDIDIARVFDTIKIIAEEKKIKTDSGNVRLFYLLWMNMLKYMGRMYEGGLVGMLNLFSGKPFKDIGLAVKMVRKGKIKLMPTIKRPVEMMKMFKRAKGIKK